MTRIIPSQHVLSDLDVTWHDSPTVNPILCCPRCGEEHRVEGWENRRGSESVSVGTETRRSRPNRRSVRSRGATPWRFSASGSPPARARWRFTNATLRASARDTSG